LNNTAALLPDSDLSVDEIVSKLFINGCY